MTSSLHHILLATDFSRTSEPAFTRAVEMAREHGATLTVLHVVSAPPASMNTDSLAPGGHLNGLRWEAQQLFSGCVQTLTEEHIAHHCRLLLGDPRHEVQHYAARHPPDLLVVGKHVRHGLAQFLRMGLSEYLVRHCDCPVLVVPDRLPPVDSPDAGRATPHLGRSGQGAR